jgi:hypothetical protein
VLDASRLVLAAVLAAPAVAARAFVSSRELAALVVLRATPAVLLAAAASGRSLAAAARVPPANWLAGLWLAASSVGCVRTALMALGAICRETVASDGPTAALLAACGPVFVATSPTVVTTLATA